MYCWYMVVTMGGRLGRRDFYDASEVTRPDEAEHPHFRFGEHLFQILVSQINTTRSSRTAHFVKMPSSLQKVTKHVNKKKGAKANSLHENSRDARRLRKAGVRDERVARLHSQKNREHHQWTERVAFFKDHLPDTLHPMEVPQIQELIRQYLDRHDVEVAELKAERRVGRPASTRQTLLEQAREMERREYESGFWVPDMREDQTLLKLDAYGGDWLSLSNMRFIRVDVNGKVHESQFPPRG